jgi:hypothetical protein
MLFHVLQSHLGYSRAYYSAIIGWKMRKSINCVLIIISWGYTNGNCSCMYQFVPLCYQDTLQVVYHILVMKNIAIWPYKEIALWPCYVLFHDGWYPKKHFLSLVHLFVLGKWTIDTQDTPYPMIYSDLVWYSSPPYSTCHGVIANVLKAPTHFTRLYEQTWGKKQANIWW